MPPFSLLLSDDAEPGLDAGALLESCRVLQSEETQRNSICWCGARAERDSGGIFDFLTLPADEGSFAQSTLNVLHQVVF